MVDITAKHQRAIDPEVILIQRLMKHKKSLAAIALLLFGTGLGAILSFATQVLLARVLGVEQFGSFSSALAIVTLLAPLAGFGLGSFWLSLYGQEGWQAQRWLPSSIRLLCSSTALVIGILLLWAILGPHDSLTRWLLTILVLHLLSQVALELIHAKYQLEGRSRWLAAWQTLPHLLRFLLVVILILLSGSSYIQVEQVALSFALVALLVVFSGIYQVRLMLKNQLQLTGHGGVAATVPQNNLSKSSVKQLVFRAWPFGLAGILYLIYFQSDIILIRYLIDESAAGIYNVAFVIMAAIYLFPGVIFQKFLLPKLHRWANYDAAQLYRVFKLGNMIMLLLGTLAMLLLWLLSPLFLPWLFGQAYQEAVTLLIILAIAAPFRFFASSTGAVLTTRGHMSTKVKLMGAIAALNILLNLYLIPIYGVTGAAVATVISDIALCALYYYFASRMMQALKMD